MLSIEVKVNTETIGLVLVRNTRKVGKDKYEYHYRLQREGMPQLEGDVIHKQSHGFWVLIKLVMQDIEKQIGEVDKDYIKHKKETLQKLIGRAHV